MDNEVLDQRVKIISKEELDDFSRANMEKELSHFVTVYEKKFGADSLNEFRITVKEVNKDGAREEYEMQANLFSTIGDFHTKKVGWHTTEVLKGVLEAINHQLDHNHNPHNNHHTKNK